MSIPLQHNTQEEPLILYRLAKGTALLKYLYFETLHSVTSCIYGNDRPVFTPFANLT